MNKIVILTATACCMASAPSLAQMSGTAPARPDMANPTPVRAMPYVAKAGASDLYETQSSQLALSQGKSPKVKAFGRMMIKHHMMTTKTLTAAANSAGMTPPPPMLEPMQVDMMSQLQPLSGDTFDQAYIAQQKTAHAMALALHQTHAAQGDSLPLKKAAAKAVPIVKHHVTLLEHM